MMIQWAVSTVLIAFGLFVAVSQWVAMADAGRRRKDNPDSSGYSFAPLLGGLVGAIGCLLSPSPTVRTLWWVLPVIDPGCVLMLLLAAVSLCLNFYRKK